MSEPIIELFHFKNFRKYIKEISSIPKSPAQFIAMGAVRPEVQAAKVNKMPCIQELKKSESEDFSERPSHDTQTL
jgi:hypothetical protein